MDTVTLTIDDHPISVSTGTSLLDAAETHHIKIPRLCHHPDLEPFGACRLCLVEDEKSGRLFASCVTPAAQDMVIRTATPRIIQHRKNIVRLMISEHPESCIVCSKGNRCQLRQIAAQLGIGETDLYPLPNPRDLEQANPFIIRDLTKCILCGKCIRADHELVSVGAIDYNLRGFKSRPTTVHDRNLEQSTCTFCGTCVSMCPTGALSTKDMHHVGTPEREAISICGFCGVGCSLSMGVFDNTIIEVNPSHRQDTVNGATLCVRGHFANDFLNNTGRLKAPLMRSADGELEPIDWDKATGEAAERLLEIQQKYGPQSIGFMGSSKCTNEENYLFQKIARSVFKTNNIDTHSYFTGQSHRALVNRRMGGGLYSSPLERLERSESILLLGADPNHSAPVVGYFLKRAAKKGIPIVVVDPRKTEIVDSSTAWLNLHPRTDIELINGLSACLIEENARDEASIRIKTTGFEVYKATLSKYYLKQVAKTTGLKLDDIRSAAALLKGKQVSVVVGQGVLQQPAGDRALDALYNLMLLTGGMGSQNTGFYLLASENNQTGAWDMGAAPDTLPGGTSVSDTEARSRWEQAWQNKISPDQGLNVVRMIEEAEKGNLKALYILGENPLRSFPHPQRVRSALESLDFLVVQDILCTDTVHIADIVLAGAPFSEKAGSFTNLEGRIQSFEPVVSPKGDAKPDWEILSAFAARAGSLKQYDTIESIREEIRRNVSPYRHLVEGTGTCWIESESHTGEYAFAPVTGIADIPSDSDFPMTAILGTTRYHLGSGTRTSQSERVRAVASTLPLEISRQDMERLKIESNHKIRVISKWGAIERGATASDDLNPGFIFIPTGSDGNNAMNLVGLTPTDHPKFTGWKTVSIKIEPIST